MVSIRTMPTGLVLFCITSIFVMRANALSCPRCDRSKCEKPTGCYHGVISDVCGCCDRCAKGLGEACGGFWTENGRCAKGLGCSTSHFYGKIGKCVPASEAAEVLD